MARVRTSTAGGSGGGGGSGSQGPPGPQQIYVQDTEPQAIAVPILWFKTNSTADPDDVVPVLIIQD